MDAGGHGMSAWAAAAADRRRGVSGISRRALERQLLSPTIAA